MKRFVSCIILSYAILIAGCSAAQSYSTTVKQNLTSAQAQATNEAIRETDSAQSAQATRQARENQTAYATRQAIDATEQARQVIARATEQARMDAANALTLDQAQAAATATREALGRQMDLDAQEAQKVQAETQATIGAATLQAIGIRATSTVVAKMQATDDDTRALEKQDAELTFWAGWILKIGAVLLVLIAGITLIEVIRKRGAVGMVGKMPVAVDGGLFGGLNVYLLEYEKPLQLPAPAQAPAQAPAGNGQMVVNGSRMVDEMSSVEAEHRQYWRTRAMRFLQDAQGVKGAGYKKIPTCREMGLPNPEWVQITDALKPWIDKKQGKPTLCIAPYETLGKLYEAVALRKIAPLPPDLYAKYVDNSYKTVTVEQSVTGDNSHNSGKQANNSTLEAISSLPQNGSSHAD